MACTPSWHWMRVVAGASCLACGGASLLLLAACHTPPATRVDAVSVRLVMQKRSWHASYVGADSSGRTTDVPTGREIHLPLGAAVRLTLSSETYASDFSVTGLELREFAAPALPSNVYFVADRAGRYEVRGDEICGLPHTDRSRGWLVVEDAATYRAWIRERIRERKG